MQALSEFDDVQFIDSLKILDVVGQHTGFHVKALLRNKRVIYPHSFFMAEGEGFSHGLFSEGNELNKLGVQNFVGAEPCLIRAQDRAQLVIGFRNNYGIYDNPFFGKPFKLCHGKGMLGIFADHRENPDIAVRDNVFHGYHISRSILSRSIFLSFLASTCAGCLSSHRRLSPLVLKSLFPGRGFNTIDLSLTSALMRLLSLKRAWFLSIFGRVTRPFLSILTSISTTHLIVGWNLLKDFGFQAN